MIVLFGATLKGYDLIDKKKIYGVIATNLKVVSIFGDCLYWKIRKQTRKIKQQSSSIVEFIQIKATNVKATC